MKTFKVNGHAIELPNPEKEMYLGENITKEDIVIFYRKISEHILPWLAERPMMLHRYPNGISDKEFYQKDTPDYFPKWIDTIRVRLKEKGRDSQELVNCNTAATLVYVATQGSITPHVWLSKKDALNYPDKMIFDLDPPNGAYEIVRDCLKDIRRIFDELELNAFLMTTGSRGLHVVLPLDRQADFDESREFAKAVAELLAAKHPDKYTVEIQKKKRGDRLFLDYLRNSYGQTSVAPYALRAREGAPIATPIDWEEAGSRDLGPQTYRYHNIFRRLGNKNDPWVGVEQRRNNLKETRGKLETFVSRGGKN